MRFFTNVDPSSLSASEFAFASHVLRYFTKLSMTPLREENWNLPYEVPPLSSQPILSIPFVGDSNAPANIPNVVSGEASDKAV